MTKKKMAIYDQLSKRVDRTLTYFEDVEFFRQIVRLMEWIHLQNEFAKVVDLLNKQKRKDEVSYVEIMGRLRLSVLNIWSELKKKKLSEKKLGFIARDASHRLSLAEKDEKYYSGIDVYHYLRMYVEGVGGGKHADIVKNYIEIKEGVPLISGEISQLFLKTCECGEMLKKKRAASDWGAWSYLTHIMYLSHESDAPGQLEDWAKVFTKSEYSAHLVRLLDFCWDVFDKRYTRNPEEKYDGNEVWDDFIVTGDDLDLKKYGKARIYFSDKAPSGLANRNTVKFIEHIVGAGKEGIEKNALCRKTGIEKRNFNKYRLGHNVKLSNALMNGDIKVMAQLVDEKNAEGLSILRLSVTETSGLNLTEHKGQ